MVGARRARSYATRSTPARSAARNRLARSSIHRVISVWAGPTEGRAYLKPPASGSARAVVRDARHAGEVRGEEPIGAVLDPPSDFGVGGAARGWIVLEAAGIGRVVRGRDDDPVGEAAGAAAIVVHDRLRDHRRRRR